MILHCQNGYKIRKNSRQAGAILYARRGRLSIGNSCTVPLLHAGPASYDVAKAEKLKCVSRLLFLSDPGCKESSCVPNCFDRALLTALVPVENRGGRFNMGKSKTDLEWVIYRTSQIPAPGVYEVEDRIPTGGKFNMVCDILREIAGIKSSAHV